MNRRQSFPWLGSWERAEPTRLPPRSPAGHPGDAPLAPTHRWLRSSWCAGR